MAEQARPTLGYWASRSICGSIRCLLAHLGIDYENKIYPVGPPPDFDKTEWFSEKFELGLTYPNLPYWIDEDVKITEGKAILKFICMKYAP
jgi:glutathione S-transferase